MSMQAMPSYLEVYDTVFFAFFSLRQVCTVTSVKFAVSHCSQTTDNDGCESRVKYRCDQCESLIRLAKVHSIVVNPCNAYYDVAVSIAAFSGDLASKRRIV